MYFGAPTKIDTQFSYIDFLSIDKNPNTHKIYGSAKNNCRRSVWNFIDPKGRIPRVYPWMNGNSPKGRRAWLEMWEGATGLPVGFPMIVISIVPV